MIKIAVTDKVNQRGKQHMRKQLIRKLAIVITTVLVISATGCGGADRQGTLEVQGTSEVQGTPEVQGTSEVQDTYWFSGKSADDILAEMTLEEKVWQMIQPAVYMANKDEMRKYDFGSVLSKADGSYPSSKEWKALILEYQNAALASESGIPFIYGQDDVHGVNYCKGSVLFPHNIGLGAANDAELVYQIGEATADEAKLTGMLWNFAPCVAVSTDPRWGRTYESYSSDPEIVGKLGEAYVKGLKDSGIAACGKHYFADGAETWGTGENGFLIDRGDADLTDEEVDALLGVYRKLIDAGVPSIMISHGSVGGVKMHENDKYISILRNELGFDGMIVSDWESIHNISGSNFSEQMANAINAGIDMLMEPNMYRETFDAVMQAVNSGAISEARIDDAVRHILQFKIEAGVMDDPLQEAVTTVQSECGSDEYRALAEKAVEESLVLLKNEGSVLPLKSGSTIYAVGPALDNIGAQCGGWTESWNGPTRPIEGATTIIEGLREAAGECGITIVTDPSQAQNADVTLLVVGEQPYAEWNGDSADISITGALALPENIGAIQEAEKLRRDYKIPTVGCILAGRQVIISDYLDQWDAAVMCYLPGSEGKGVANVLTGQAAFTGKLPMPWYESVEQIGTDKCLFPVGYGLDGDTSGGGTSEVSGGGTSGRDTSEVEPGRDTSEVKPEVKPEPDEADSKGLVKEFGGHTYTIVEEGLAWSDAEAYCVEHGGHLASAGSVEEQAFLDQFAESSTHSNIWIGGFIDQDGKWQWTDGTEFSYANWDDKQPDNYEGRETCIRFTNKEIQYPEWTAHKGKWNDTANQGDKEAKLSDFAFIMEVGN